MTIMVRTRTLLFTSALLLTFTQSGLPADSDPTTVSPQIKARMQHHDQALRRQPGANKEAPEVFLHQIRLRAMVLRDRNHGTALVSVDGKQVYFVMLRRMSKHATATRLEIAGIRLQVKDFSESSVTLVDLDQHQEVVVRRRLND